LSYRSNRQAVWLLLFSGSLFALLLPFSCYVAAIPFVRIEWEMSNVMSAVVYSGFFLGYAISALLVLPLTDKFTPAKILLCSAVVCVVSNVMFPILATGFLGAFCVRMITGVGLVGVYMTGLRVIAHTFPAERKAAAMGFFVTAFYLALGMSLLASGLLLDHLSWRSTYLLLSILALVSLPLFYLALRSNLGIDSVSNSGWLMDIRVLLFSDARSYVIAYSIHAFELYAVRVWLPAFLLYVISVNDPVLHAGDVARSTVAAGVVLTVGSMCPFLGGLASDHFGRYSVSLALLGSSVVCSALLGFLVSIPWLGLIIFLIFYACVISADSSIYSTAITESVPTAVLGSTMAVQAFLGLVGGAAGPIVLGLIFDMTGGYIKWPLGFGLLSAMSLVAVVAVGRTRLTGGRY